MCVAEDCDRYRREEPIMVIRDPCSVQAGRSPLLSQPLSLATTFVAIIQAVSRHIPDMCMVMDLLVWLPAGFIHTLVHTYLDANVWCEYRHNQRTRPTTHTLHVPSTAPHALKLLLPCTQSWVFTHPFTPMAVRYAG